MRRVLRKVDWQYCWVTTDICDYKHFDFTWHPSEYQQDMLHVFSSSKQKFGDTFYVHVPSFLEKTKDLKILEWFETLHFIDAQVPRYGVDYVPYESDSVLMQYGHTNLKIHLQCSVDMNMLYPLL